MDQVFRPVVIGGSISNLLFNPFKIWVCCGCKMFYFAGAVVNHNQYIQDLEC